MKSGDRIRELIKKNACAPFNRTPIGQRRWCPLGNADTNSLD